MSEIEWKPYHDPYRTETDRPWLHEWIWLWREGWPEPQKTRHQDINPALNVIGLMWHPAPSKLDA